MHIFSLLLLACGVVTASSSGSTSHDIDAHNNWAVLICASRFWFNYRHIANTLSMYRTVKRLGIPDSQILLMLADDVACNPRNIFPAKVINNANARLDLYGENVEVDYRGYEVTAESVIRLLTDRLPRHVPRSKRLLTDEESRILVFMTGHGGDEFLKYQDAEELGAHDIADAINQMKQGNRFKELLFLVDTCQANTMYKHIHSHGVVAAGSSEFGENSYSHHMDMDLGVAVIDRFTYYVLEFIEHLTRRTATSSSLNQLFRSLSFDKMLSHVGTRADLFDRSLNDASIADFFSGRRPVQVVNHSVHVNLSAATDLPRTLHPTQDEVVQSSLTNPVDTVRPINHNIAWVPFTVLVAFFGLIYFIT